jgi:hypothetical protein
MEMIILYLLAHVFMGAYTAFMGIYINLESHKTKFMPYYCIIAIIYIAYMATMIGLASLIAWIDKHYLISQVYNMASTILMLLSVYPSFLLAKKLLGPTRNIFK